MEATIFIFLLIPSVVLSQRYEISPPIPVASPEPGIRYNPAGPFEPNVPVKIEIFLCPNSGDSYRQLPVIKAVADHYGNQLVNLVVEFLPLPYHRNAMLSTQGVFLIEEHEPFYTFTFLEAVLAQNMNFSTVETVDKTETEVLGMLADIAVATTPIDRQFFNDNINLYRSRVVQAWKYSVKRLNAATPSFSVNGVSLEVTQYPTYDEWIKFLDKIVYP